MWFKKKIGLRLCVNVVKIVLPSVLGFDDGGQYAEKKKWFKKNTSLKWCANVVIIAMLNALGFDDGSHHVGKRTNVVKIAMLSILGFNDLAIIVERKKCGLRRRWV
jgi:hypothetical protein